MSRYKKETKIKILQSRLECESISELSGRTGISKTSLYRWSLDHRVEKVESKFKPLIVEKPTNSGYSMTIHSGGAMIELTGTISPEYIRTLLGW